MNKSEFFVVVLIIALPSFFAFYILNSSNKIGQDIDLNLNLSIRRTQMANTRTYLAFVRTAIMFSILALGLYNNFKDKKLDVVFIGVAFSFAILIVGVFYWLKYSKLINRTSQNEQ
jgi:uncharacterized membrane protein YidH (DUF202 family)